jgi:hypothetical protein
MKGETLRRKSVQEVIILFIESLVLYTTAINSQIVSPLVTRMCGVLRRVGATLPCKSL